MLAGTVSATNRNDGNADSDGRGEKQKHIHDAFSSDGDENCLVRLRICAMAFDALSVRRGL